MSDRASPWNLVDHLAVDELIVQGHRGAGELAEENTIEAFKLAWSMQLYPEADLRMTRDGVIVPFHDPDFNRVVKDLPPELRDKGVENVTFAELSRLNLGSWHGGQRKECHVVPMTTIFARMRGRPGRHLYMDVKQVDFSQLAEEVRRCAVERQVVLASREIADLRTWKSLVPSGETLLWIHGNEADIRRDLATYRQERFAGITQVQLHIYPKVTDDAWAPPADPSPADDPFRLSNDFLRAVGDELRAHGVLYQAFPITTETSAYAQLMDLGFMSFATDHAVDAWREIRRYYDQRRKPASVIPQNSLSAGAPSNRSGRLESALALARDTKALHIEPDALRRCVECFAAQFPSQKAQIVADTTTFAVAGAKVQAALAAAGLADAAPVILPAQGLYAEYRWVETLREHFVQHEAIPVAVGAGTINDLVKLAAHLAGRRYLCVATAASMDGYTAYGASITRDGSKQTFGCPAPQAVLADLDILAGAPPAMTASGYADLQAKITAGADWILADELGIEPIDAEVWGLVQDNLRHALAQPAAARAGDHAAIAALTTGLMLGGFAMQRHQTSRPASGAEHQFSHLWDMEHLAGETGAPSHGFKVGVATLTVAALYEAILRRPLDQVDLTACVAAWPDWPATERQIHTLFPNADFIATPLRETQLKHPSPEVLRAQLQRLKTRWPHLRARLQAHLLPAAELRRNLALAGAPVTPAAIGLTPNRLRESFLRASYIRRRFTVLDLAVRTGQLEECLSEIFPATGSKFG